MRNLLLTTISVAAMSVAGAERFDDDRRRRRLGHSWRSLLTRPLVAHK
jgi:hypothetical protein